MQAPAMSETFSDIPGKIENVIRAKASSQMKLTVDNDDDDIGDDDVSYHSVDAEENAEQVQKEEDKPKPKLPLSLKHKLDESLIKAFITANIFQRHCSSFISAKESRDLCQCGLKSAGHDPAFLSQSVQPNGSKQKWEADLCTVKVPTNCYGFVNFDGFGQEASRKVPYIRIDYQTDQPIVWELLKTYWKIPEPKLIISITGGAKRLYIKPRLMNSFRRGLINAVTAADAWIVTGGTNTGVMEIVGDAVHDYMLQMGGMGRRIVTLGIATWGLVANKVSLTVSDNNGTQEEVAVSSTPSGSTMPVLPATSVPDIIPLAPLSTSAQDVTPEQPAKLTTDQLTAMALKKLHRAVYKFDDLRSPENQGRVALNPFHSHFILVDNGTDGKSGFEINLRANLEQYIAKQCEGQVVLIVLEGGEKTLETTAEAIDRDTPVVVIKGSGRAADVIAHAYYKYKTLAEKTKDLDKDSELKAKLAFEEDLKAKAVKAFDWAKETDPDVLKKRTKTGMKHLNNILQKIHLVVIYNLDDSSGDTTEMDQSILKALLQAQPNDTQSQLGLALAWNCCEVARQEIFSIETRLQWQKIDLHSSMHTAIVENKIDFAQLFMDSGVNLKNFLTIRRLEELYRDVLDDDRPDSCTEILKNLVSEQQRQSCFFCCRGTKQDVDSDDFSLETIGNVINKLTSDEQENVYRDISSTCKDTLMPFPERELFYFALLLGRKEMAIQFWKCGRDHIGGALTASVICRNLAQIAENEEELDLHQELNDSAAEFESYAVGVLNQCYQLDKHSAHMLLTRELDLWGNRTLFMIADDAGQMEFMEQSCCQTQLNKSWTGRMAAHTPSWKIIFGLFFLTIPLIKFTKEQRELKSVDQDGDVEDDAEPEGHFYNVGLTTNKKKNVIGILPAIYLFLMSPLVKFCYHALSLVVYIGLFSYFLLTNLRPDEEPDSPGACEIVIWIWTATLILEEIRQIFASESLAISAKVSSYFASRWNQFDVIIYLLFIVAFTLRFALHGDEFDWARMVYTITLMLFFVRLLQFFFVHKDIGPKVIIFGGMMTDLLLFILLLAIFVVSYGIAARVLLYPNATPSWNILLSILYEPYFQLYGAINQDEALGVRDSSCPSNDTYYNDDPSSERCPKKSWLVMVLLAIELLLTNILLLNLLIAMFSYTFTVIQENSEKVWRYYRYSLIYEYFSKPILAPPLIIFIHIWRFGKNVYYRCLHPDHKMQHHFRRSLMFDENKKLTAVERAGMENHLIKRQKSMQEKIDFKISSTSERVEKMADDIEQLKEQLNSHKDVRNLIGPSSPAVSSSSVNLNSIEATKQTQMGNASDFTAIMTEHTTAITSTRNELSAIRGSLDHHSEILNKLLNIMTASHPRLERQRHNSRQSPQTPKTLPKVD